MNIVFLKAPIPLTKTYVRQADGSIDKQPYPNAYEFTSIEEPCTDIAHFATLLKKHAALGHTLLKGTIARPLVAESRKGSTDSNGLTHWVVFDLDGLPGITDPEQFLKAVGLDDISYVAQYSASYGIENNDLRAHVFMHLTKPMAAPLLKQWLIDMNHRVDLLRNAMTLTKTANSLSWPLDVTACQNDKLIYIAPPLLKGGLKDPMGKKPRIVYVGKKHTKLAITSAIPTTEANKTKTDKRVNELREQQGIPARKFTYKIVGSTQVLSKPDGATISEVKVDRGFVYFNLNGGDSWAYYHPENNPDFIFNFKGEPAYLTKELLPDYWEQLTQQTTKTTSGGITYLTFLDRVTSAYYRGTYDAALDILDINQAKNETQVRHFAKQHGVPLGDFIPEWDLIFDPHAPLTAPRVDVTARTVNLYQATPYARAKPKKVGIMPPQISKVIHHALGGDPATVDHFINWLACILQFKQRMLTAWVLHGKEGTGKGTIMHRIIRPILGLDNTVVRHMDELNEHFNHWMENKFVIFIDEIEAKALNNERGVAAKLRNFITEPTIPIRAMHQGSREVTNYGNWIFGSNMPEPIVISAGDRRYNIGGFQEHRLVMGEKEMQKIDSELQNFHDYLITYKADIIRAATVLDTQDRRTLISIAETSIDVAVGRVLGGDLEFFIDQLPSDDSYKRNALRASKVEDYKEVLVNLIDRTLHTGTGECNISRDELHVLFGYTVGNLPDTPNKFTSMLKHHRIHIGKVWIDSRSVQGIKATWTPDMDDLKALKEIVVPAEKPVRLKAVGGKK